MNFHSTCVAFGQISRRQSISRQLWTDMSASTAAILVFTHQCSTLSSCKRCPLKSKQTLNSSVFFQVTRCFSSLKDLKRNGRTSCQRDFFFFFFELINSFYLFSTVESPYRFLNKSQAGKEEQISLKSVEGRQNKHLNTALQIPKGKNPVALYQIL